MTKIAAAVDPALLERMLAWTRGFADFEPHHAADGLFIGAACRHGALPPDPEAAFLVGLVNTFWFWFDDRADRFRCGPETWDALLAFTADPTRELADAPELRFFQRMSAALQDRAQDPAEHRWWLACSADTLRATYAEWRMTRAGRVASYADALEIGGDSTNLTSVVSAANLAYGMNRPARAADQRLARAERYMCLSQRLLNDLFSVEKERREGHAGRVSNIVLLLETWMPPAEARAFVAAQQRAYEDMMLQSLELLGPDDEFGRLIGEFVRAIPGWYEAGPVRYELEGGAP